MKTLTLILLALYFTPSAFAQQSDAMRVAIRGAHEMSEGNRQWLRALSGAKPARRGEAWRGYQEMIKGEQEYKRRMKQIWGSNEAQETVEFQIAELDAGTDVQLESDAN